MERRDVSNPSHLLTLLLPEIVVAICALAVLFVDVSLLRQKSIEVRSRASSAITILGCLVAIVCAARNTPANAFAMVDLTAVGPVVKIVLLALTIFTALISWEARFTRHIGEYYALLLLAAVGLMLLISSNNLLMIFVAVELVSLSLYAMTALNKSSAASAEAALKYFLSGGTAAAFMLYGISLLYGLTGSLDLEIIASSLQTHALEPLHYLAIVLTITGFAFKIAAAPFHLWAPDVYVAAPTPIASFIASASKVASFFVLARVLLIGFAGGPGWTTILAVLAALSMVLGSVAAIAQTRVKRLLAYSAIANAGYALLALWSGEARAVSSLLFFVITYAVTVLGAFGIVSLVENDGKRDELSAFAGLSRRAPVLSMCMLVFLLSLAGIPPLSGFFGKFYIFTAALSGPEHLRPLWLVVLGAATSAISLYYYLQVLKQIYVVPAAAGAKPLPVNGPATFAVVALAIIVVVLGCVPSLLLNNLGSGLSLLASRL
ncbi:MAG: dehydrogenase subunit [Verrucomicrobiales bacterium]|nr:dehydrogenase subunit [Verrucomicrobiales bacterium]